jgi:hypothetical protein
MVVKKPVKSESNVSERMTSHVPDQRREQRVAVVQLFGESAVGVGGRDRANRIAQQRA